MNKEEVFLRDIDKTKKTWKFNLNFNLEDQKWICYLTAGSFIFLIILNSLLLHPYVPKEPYNFKAGFIGLGLTFFGLILLLNFTFTSSKILIGIVEIVLIIIFLYFGIPLLIGFSW